MSSVRRRVFLLAIASCAASACDAPHPTDAALAAEFRDNRAGYETLLKMVREETRVTRISYDFIWIDGAGSPTPAQRAALLPKARWDRYRRLFKALKLESGVMRWPESGSVGFFRSSSGLAVSGSGKSIVWSPTPLPDALAPSDRRTTEQACTSGECHEVRQIAPEWYIAFEAT